MSSTTDRVRRLGPAQRASIPVLLLRLLLWVTALVAAILLVSSARAWWVEDLEPRQAAPQTCRWDDISTSWARNPITPPVQAEAFTKLVPRSKLVLLPGVGHIPQIEDASLFNARLSEVLGAVVR
jgi:pimeloyl-ACP methyl ester carboxylesterase